jgi:hypothetical protein
MIQVERATLFERLGGETMLRRIVAEVVAQRFADPMANGRHGDRDAVMSAAFAFCAAGTGGPSPYTGPDVLTTDNGSNVSVAEFDAAIDATVDALRANDVDETAQHEVLAALWGLKVEAVSV